jgi:hypothetical protein
VLEKEVAMNQPPDAPEKRRRIYFGLALVLFGCCGCAAHLATVETKTPRLSAMVASEAHLGVYKVRILRFLSGGERYAPSFFRG